MATPPVIDCFTFFNELDLLELRLRYLYDVVERFVLVESRLTHSGSAKPLYYAENRSRFSWAESKIVHVVEELPVTSEDSWIRENQQRNAIVKGLKDVSPGARVMVSDLDEIPSRVGVSRAIARSRPVSMRQTLHYYYVNYRSCGSKHRFWQGTVVAPVETVHQTTPQKLREAGMHGKYSAIRDGGWHFSYLGGKQSIREKLRSYAHTENDREEFASDANIESALTEGRDLFGRREMRFERIAVSSFPSDLAVLIQDYPHLVL